MAFSLLFFFGTVSLCLQTFIKWFCFLKTQKLSEDWTFLVSVFLPFEQFSCCFSQTLTAFFRLLTGSFVLALYHLNGLWSHSSVKFCIVLILLPSLEFWSEAVSSALSLLIAFFSDPHYTLLGNSTSLPRKMVSLTLETWLCYCFTKDAELGSHAQRLLSRVYSYKHT